MTSGASLQHVSDQELIDELKRLAQSERSATAALVASLAEVDARRLYLGEGCSSLFTYCTQVLRLSEHAAYGRIEAARAVRRFPIVLDRLAAGELTLTAISLLRPHLTDDNHRDLLDAARHQSKRTVEELVARVHPKPDAAALVRRMPDRRAAPGPVEQSPARGTPAGGSALGFDAPEPPVESTAAIPSSTTPPRTPPALVKPLAPERSKVQFTISRATRDKLRHAQDLLRHVVPDGDPAEVFDRALTLLVEHLERTRLGSVKKPRGAWSTANGSRTIPAVVRRAVWRRDDGRCAFVGREGRCTETGFLEFHHTLPYARGGPATLDNIELRCRAHNQYEAEEWFGPIRDFR